MSHIAYSRCHGAMSASRMNSTSWPATTRSSVHPPRPAGINRPRPRGLCGPNTGSCSTLLSLTTRSPSRTTHLPRPDAEATHALAGVRLRLVLHARWQAAGVRSDTSGCSQDSGGVSSCVRGDASLAAAKNCTDTHTDNYEQRSPT